MALLRVILLIIIFTSTISIIFGYNLPRNVLDPLANMAVHNTVYVIKVAHLADIVGFALAPASETPTHSVFGSNGEVEEAPNANKQHAGTEGKSARKRNPIFVSATVKDADNNKRRKKNEVEHQPIPPFSTFRSRGGEGIALQLFSGLLKDDGWVPPSFPVFYDAYNFGSTVRFAYFLDLVVDVSTLSYRLVGNSLRDLASFFVGGGSSGTSVDNEEEEELEVVDRSKNRHSQKAEDEAAMKHHSHFPAGDVNDPSTAAHYGYPLYKYAFVRNWDGGATTNGTTSQLLSGEKEAAGTSFAKTMSSSSLAKDFKSRSDWESLDYTLTNGRYDKRVVLMGVTQSKNHDAAQKTSLLSPAAPPSAGTLVSIKELYLRPFKPSIDLFLMIHGEVRKKEAAGGVSTATDSVSIESVEGAPFEAEEPMTVVDISTNLQKLSNFTALLAALESQRNALIGGQLDTKTARQNEAEHGLGDANTNDKEGSNDKDDAVGDWRTRMREQYEAQQRQKDKAAAFSEKHKKVPPTGTKDGNNKKKTPNQSGIKVIDNVFVPLSGGLPSVLAPAPMVVSESNGIVYDNSSTALRYLFGDRTVLPCFDAALMAVLQRRTSTLPAPPSSPTSYNVHFVCPAALMYGRRGMRTFKIPPFAAVEVVVEGITLDM